MMDRFALAYREQQQLFLLDKTFLVDTLFRVGGLATLCGQFVVQFFCRPALAVVLTLVLLGLGAWLLWASVRRSRADWFLLPLCLIPFFFLAASLSENAMHFSALAAWLLALAVLWGFSRIRARRLFWGAVLTVVLYLAAGPAALLFAACAAILGLVGRREWVMLLLVPLALLCGLGALWMGWTPTLATAWTPAFYYDLDATMPFAHWAAWIALPLVVAIAAVLQPHAVIPPSHAVILNEVKELARMRSFGKPQDDRNTPQDDRKACQDVKKRWRALALGSGLLAVAALCAFLIARWFETRQPNLTYEYEYYVAREDWDGLAAACRRHEWIPHTAQYLNLALAWKGTLVDDLFRYDQRGPNGLVMMGGDRGIENSQAHIMFAMGNYAGAQDVAFNTLYSTEGICPEMLKMNARIELMRGALDIADKYLSILEKAPHYREWAQSQRRFLHDDAALQADPLLGTGRRSWPAIEGFSMYESPLVELLRVVEANPAHERAVAYALAYMLLSKDVQSLATFVDRYYGTPALQTLPQPVQEAVLFYSEYARNVGGTDIYGPEWCRSHGVSPLTERRFADFQQASLPLNGKAPTTYRGTFWYYLMNTQI